MSEKRKFRTDIFLSMVLGVPLVSLFLVNLPNLVGKDAAIVLLIAVPFVGLAWLVSLPMDRKG